MVPEELQNRINKSIEDVQADLLKFQKESMEKFPDTDTSVVIGGWASIKVAELQLSVDLIREGLAKVSQDHRDLFAALKHLQK